MAITISGQRLNVDIQDPGTDGLIPVFVYCNSTAQSKTMYLEQNQLAEVFVFGGLENLLKEELMNVFLNS